MTYIAINLITYIREPLSNPAVSIAGREPTRGLRVHYCYSSALQNGGEYAEIYGPRPRRHMVYTSRSVRDGISSHRLKRLRHN